MKILLLNYTDASGGGAANAVFRLTQSLNERGISATLGVVEKKTSSEYVISCKRKHKNLFLKLFHKMLHFYYSLFKKNIFFKTTNNIFHSFNYLSLIDINWINSSDFDVVHIHWIHNNMLSIKDISKIQKPIVWTTHDSWICCGAEHHPNILENDSRYINGYSKKNKPLTTKGIDICKKIWLKKKKYLNKKNITFIAPSNWQSDIIKKSLLFRHNKVYVIPNIVNSMDFYPKNKKEIKHMFEIPTDKKIIGFGAAYGLREKKSMKGTEYLLQLLRKIDNPENYFLIIFGPVEDNFIKNISIPFFATGYIFNQKILASIYNLCDVIINPSLIENLPYICLESIKCGIPVVAFDVGGTKDIIEHKKTGYLATPYNVEELLEGLNYCFQNSNCLLQNCLEKSNKDFNLDKIIEKHIDVYKSVML